MIKNYCFFAILFLCGICSKPLGTTHKTTEIEIRLDVSNHLDDKFHVTIFTKDLGPQNNIYHFPSVVPGTYSIMDLGRFVETVKAFDSEGKKIGVKKISTNAWRVSDPVKLSRLEYVVNDTFDSNIKKNKVNPHCGSGIEKDFIYINTHAIFGYFENLQFFPVKLEINCNPDWTIGTSLDKISDKLYYAKTYNHLADSPIIMGKMSVATKRIKNIDISVFVYPENYIHPADSILSMAGLIFNSAEDFFGYAPVPSYSFLMCFLSDEMIKRNKLRAFGALEHGYSSSYVLPEGTNLKSLRATMAHEFLHILTPLNLRSEIIKDFNFEEPTASRHLWLYEGVVEWASDIMQCRSGILSHRQYLNELSIKMNTNAKFRQDIGLDKMSKEVYDKNIRHLFSNFYHRGALVAALLDIRLLELSDTRIGLRDILVDLVKKFGQDKAFSEEEFYDFFVSSTFPEIRQFIDDFIIGFKPLPYKEYFQKAGMLYSSERISTNKEPVFGCEISINSKGECFVFNVTKKAKNYGLRNGDVLVKMFDTEVNSETIVQLYNKAMTKKAGDTFNLVILKGKKEKVLKAELFQRIDTHVLTELEQLTNSQKLLKQKWLGY